MTQQNPKIQLQIDPARLSAIIDRAVIVASEAVNLHFSALATIDLSRQPEWTEQRFQIRGPEISAETRRTMHENWILAKAFQEMLRAVRHSLEEAHVFASLLTRAHKIRSSSTLVDFLKPFQRQAAGLKFPELLEAVNEKLDRKIEFSKSYISLQKARNCLEHRNGIVSAIETHGNQEFSLNFPRVKIFYIRNGTEVELEAGTVVEPGDDREEVEVFMKLETRSRVVPGGQRITFTRNEFNEIAFACYLLGQQLSSRLPRPNVKVNQH